MRNDSHSVTCLARLFSYELASETISSSGDKLICDLADEKFSAEKVSLLLGLFGRAVFVSFWLTIVMPPVFGADGRTETSLRQVSNVCSNFFMLIKYFVISNSSKYKVLLEYHDFFAS